LPRESMMMRTVEMLTSKILATKMMSGMMTQAVTSNGNS